MGLFDSIIGSVMGSGALQGAMGNVLGSILSGQGEGRGPSPGHASEVGGLPGLVEKFSHAGLGNVVGSWIGTGPNQQVSPDALSKVFPQQQIDQWSQQTGMSQDGLLASLSKILPQAVDHATPNGEIPSSPFDAPGMEMPEARR